VLVTDITLADIRFRKGKALTVFLVLISWGHKRQHNVPPLEYLLVGPASHLARGSTIMGDGGGKVNVRLRTGSCMKFGLLTKRISLLRDAKCQKSLLGGILRKTITLFLSPWMDGGV